MSTTILTNTVIYNILMQKTLKTTGLKTKKEAFALGLKTLITLRKQATIKEFRGKLHWAGNLDEFRTDR
jgi:Arc/MetJ family transcription regulator